MRQCKRPKKTFRKGLKIMAMIMIAVLMISNVGSVIYAGTTSDTSSNPSEANDLGASASENTAVSSVTHPEKSVVKAATASEKTQQQTPASNDKNSSDKENGQKNIGGGTSEATSFTAYVVSGEKRADLTENGDNSELSVGWTDQMSLHIDASFGEGKNKEIEISLPDGMSFYIDTNAYYQTSNLDGYLKNKITPPEQADESKKNHTLLGKNQYNGTMTLQFFSEGDDNDVSRVSFDVPLGTAFYPGRNSGSWESGTAWYYDSLDFPITVSQSMNGKNQGSKKLGKLNITNDENVHYVSSWNTISQYRPEVLPDKETTGTELLGVYPIPGWPYVKDIAYKHYYVTFLAPEHAIFKGFSNQHAQTKVGGGTYNLSSGNYNNVKPEISNDGDKTTSLGDSIPEGYKAYTWKIDNAIVNPTQLRVCPVFVFPSDYFGSGEGKENTATIKIAYVHAQYYGRKYAKGAEENLDTAHFPSVTYDVRDEYEEVFAGSYTDEVDKDSNRKHESDFYESDYNLNLGAPGFEHTQEREAGYFMIGNRGLKDSVPKTITYEFDQKNTGAIGITQAEIPSYSSDRNKSKFEITNISYKTWDSKKGKPDDQNVSGWQEYTGKDHVINLKDLNIPGDSGTYIKAIKFDISTIPKQAYLKSGLPSGESAYRFYCNIVTDDVHTIKSQVDAGDIVSVMTIANKNGDDHEQTDTAAKSVYGRAYDGTTGQKYIVGCSHDYRNPTSLQVGKGSKEVVSYIHHYSIANAQIVDKIYLISPFGEDFTNIQMHYEANWDKASLNAKRYLHSTSEPQPEITEVKNSKISEELRAKYPKAKYYVLDFTNINDRQEKYDSRQIGASVLNRKSSENTPFSTYTSNYPGLDQGVWITYDFSPDISDPTGDFTDVTWVEYNSGDDIDKVKYDDAAGGWNVSGSTDNFHLTDNPSKKHLGRMNGFVLTPTEGLVVDSAAKQTDEVDDEHWWRTFNGNKNYADNKTVLEMYKDIDYRLTVENVSSLPVSGVVAYFPVPKKDENWGETMSPDGAFKFTMDLKQGGIQNVPEGYRVSYCKNADPTSLYENWSGYDWTEQSATSSWTQSDWNAVNFIRVDWVGLDDKENIEYGDSAKFVFPMTIDSASSEAGDIGKVDIWQPYFARTYTNGTTWLAGSPVAVMPVAGFMEGTVWEDGNQNSVLDKNEKGIGNVHVQLYDVSDPQNPVLRVDNVHTDEKGHYRFNGLDDGTVAKDWQDYCRIVVTNPSDDPDAEDALYSGFSRFKSVTSGQMSMKSTDNKTASVTGRPGIKSGESVYDCGLIRNGGNINVRLVVNPKNDLIRKERKYKVQIDVGKLKGEYVSAGIQDNISLNNGMADVDLADEDSISVFSLPSSEQFTVSVKGIDPKEFTVSYTLNGTPTDNISGMIKKRETQNVVITLTPVTANARLYKIDRNGDENTYLTGSEFTLQKVDDSGLTNDDIISSQTILPGNQNGKIKAGKDGAVINTLVKGTYVLTETRAPGGYKRLASGITFNVDNGTITSANDDLIVEQKDGTYILKVKNTPGNRLPDTGGSGTFVLYLAGGLAVLAAVVLMMRKKKA